MADLGRGRGPSGWIARSSLHWIWPSAALWPSAVIAFGLRIAERVVANLPGADSGAPLFRSLREGLELFLILFVVAYRSTSGPATAAAPPMRAPMPA